MSGSSKIRRLARVGGSLLVAAGICRGIWQFVPTRLSVTTPIVGYPIFADFDYHRYFDAFYLVAFAFPGLAIVINALAARLGPLRSPPPQRPIRPVALAGDELESTVSSTGAPAVVAPGRQRPVPARLCLLGSCLARLGLPALVLGFEVSAGRRAGGRGLGTAGIAAALAYAAVVVACALVICGLARRRRSGQRRPRQIGDVVATVNGFAALVTVPGLYLVSRATNVQVASPERTVPYPWLPAWLAAVFTVAAVATCLFAYRRRAPEGRARAVESGVLAVVVATVALFLVIAVLPGANGAFGGFDDAQYMAGAQLVFGHGLLPWRDVYLLHGLIEDVFDGAIGFGVFSHSRWGANAGLSVVVWPISYCTYYLFTVYFCRRQRLLAAVAWVVIATGQFGAVMRFAYLPLVVVLFDKVLRRRSRAWCALFMLALVVESLLTPEMVLMAAGVLATLVVSEWCSRPPRGGLVAGFPLTMACAAFGALYSAAALVYLLATSSLGGFIDYYRIFGSDHALWGAFPTQWSLRGDPRITVYFLLPVALFLLTAARVSWAFATRRGLSARQWCLVAAASFVALYYQKGLDRPDSGHVVEVFTVATPLVLLWGIDLVAALERLARGAASTLVATARRARRWGLPHGLERVVVPLGLAVAVGLVAVPSLWQIVSVVPLQLHAAAETEPPLALLGYTVPGSVDVAEIAALGRVLDAYAGTSGPVFDFANEPGIVYFLENRVPGSRFFHVEEAETPAAQDEVISELEASRPRVVVFTDDTFGLVTSDGIEGPIRNYLVSAYLLGHYRPLGDVDGQLVLIRDDLAASVPPIASLHIPGVVPASRQLYFVSFPCAWGDIPDFLTPPSSPARATPVALSAPAVVDTEITGWAVDDRLLRPAGGVLAVSRGVVVASTTPDVTRSDVADYFHNDGVEASGFVLNLELKHGEHVVLYAVNADGTVSRIAPSRAPGTALPRFLGAGGGRTSIRLEDGATVRVERGTHLSGLLNAFSQVRERIFTLTLPPRFAASDWLELASPQALGTASFLLGDPPYESGRTISFNTLPRVGREVAVDVGACLQWPGYRRTLTLIEQSPSRAPLRASLAR